MSQLSSYKQMFSWIQKKQSEVLRATSLRNTYFPRDVWFQTHVWIKPLAQNRLWIDVSWSQSDGCQWGWRAPDRCAISHGIIHPHDEWEASRQAPGSHGNQHPWRSALQPRAPSQLSLRASSPSFLSNVLLWGTLSNVFWPNSKVPNTAFCLLPCPPLQPVHIGYKISCSSITQPQYLSLNLFQVLAETVFQGECLSPWGSGTKSLLIWEQFRTRKFLFLLRVSWLRFETPSIYRLQKALENQGQGQTDSGDTGWWSINTQRLDKWSQHLIIFSYQDILHLENLNSRAEGWSSKCWVFPSANISVF